MQGLTIGQSTMGMLSAKFYVKHLYHILRGPGNTPVEAESL